MNHSDVRRVMEAVADRTLPVRPGDMLFFKFTQERMFIVCSSEQLQHLQGGQPGQHVAGIRGGNGKWRWENVWLNWEGLNAFWTIHRTS